MPYGLNGYYRGDYSTGYYRGDPGLLKFFGSVAKTAAGVIGKIAGATPAGAIVKGAIGTIAKTAPQITPLMQVPDVPKGTPGAVPQIGMRGAIERVLPFGQSGYQAAPSGYHVNKAYKRYLIAQSQGRDHEDPTKEPRVVNAIVRNRSMNFTNARALKRAVRRAQMFARYARTVMSFVDARAPKGRARFKRKRS